LQAGCGESIGAVVAGESAHRQGVKHHCQAVPQGELVRKTVVSSLFTSMYFRSSARGRFPLQFDLIVINGGTDEIF
jgi:hypothetical protein